MFESIQEAIWVMGEYSSQTVMIGLVISIALVVWGSRRVRPGVKTALLIVGVFALWAALFLAADAGYRAWQESPNPPDEAFSDAGGPFFFLLLGWLPSGILLGSVFLLASTLWPRGARVKRPASPESKP
jgi:hypothetical protein